MTTDLPYYLAFARVKGIGAVRVRKLKTHFGELRLAWDAGEFDLMSAGLDTKAIASLRESRKTIVPEAEVAQLHKAGANALTWDDPHYPRLLREVAEMLAGDMARNQITVVSGMARGIDAVAHQAAINVNGRTIAVLGCGVDVVYPPEHRRLAQQIIEHGAIVSDYPIGTPPDAANFPPRNRIISGLSLGVVVVEADERSGALITTEFAAEQGRDVFAVPGNIFNKSSRGANKLIQQGAKVVLDTQSVLEELNLNMVAAQAEVQAALPDDPTERTIYGQLTHEPTEVNDLVRALDMPAEAVTTALTLMELKGMVRQASGTSYVLAREAREKYES